MENKNSILFIALKLTSICFVAVLLLGIINAFTAPKIEENRKKTENEAVKELMPDATKFNKKEFKNIDKGLKKTFYYYEAFNNSSELIGYVVSSEGNGYGGKLKVMVSVDTSFEIINVKLLDNDETPGLGKKAENPDYMKKFIGTNTAEKPFPATKNMLPPDEKDAVTGATITFNGLTEAITKALKYLEEIK